MQLENEKSMFQMSKENFKKMMDQLVNQFQLEKNNSQLPTNPQSSSSPQSPPPSTPL